VPQEVSLHTSLRSARQVSPERPKLRAARKSGEEVTFQVTLRIPARISPPFFLQELFMHTVTCAAAIMALALMTTIAFA
jgi:hypothetical protein